MEPHKMAPAGRQESSMTGGAKVIPLLLVLVGLPARGKSTVANKLRSFLNWRGCACRNFNVGASRRKEQPNTIGESHDFFSATNVGARTVREQLALSVLHSALDWLAYEGGHVAILDATNSTRARRLAILRHVHEWGQSEGLGKAVSPGAHSANSHLGVGGHTRPLPSVIFVECICNDEAVLRSNVLQKVLNSPDYVNVPVEAALADLTTRISEYEKAYETIDERLEDEASPLGPLSYMKLIDLSAKVVCRNLPGGSLPFSIVSYLMVQHVGSRPIWLVRAGQVTSQDMRAMLAAQSRRRMQSHGGSPSSQPPPEQGVAVPIPLALLSNSMSLNEQGQAFAAMVADFVLRRTAGGRLRTRAQPGLGTGRVRHLTEADPIVPLRLSAGSGGQALTLTAGSGGPTHTRDEEGGGALSVEGEEEEDGVVLTSMTVVEEHYHDTSLLVFDKGPAVFTSLLPRTIQTAAPLALHFPVEATAALNPMSTGIALGVPLQHLASAFPDEWRAFQGAEDKAHHRVTGGESLADVVARLTPFVIELERQRRPVLIVAHMSTLQVLLSYFRGSPLASAVDIPVPMNVLVEMTPHQYGWIERHYTFTKAASDDVITDMFRSPGQPEQGVE